MTNLDFYRILFPEISDKSLQAVSRMVHYGIIKKEFETCLFYERTKKSNSLLDFSQFYNEQYEYIKGWFLDMHMIENQEDWILHKEKLKSRFERIANIPHSEINYCKLRVNNSKNKDEEFLYKSILDRLLTLYNIRNEVLEDKDNLTTTFLSKIKFSNINLWDLWPILKLRHNNNKEDIVKYYKENKGFNVEETIKKYVKNLKVEIKGNVFNTIKQENKEEIKLYFEDLLTSFNYYKLDNITPNINNSGIKKIKI